MSHRPGPTPHPPPPPFCSPPSAPESSPGPQILRPSSKRFARARCSTRAVKSMASGPCVWSFPNAWRQKRGKPSDSSSGRLPLWMPKHVPSKKKEGAPWAGNAGKTQRKFCYSRLLRRPWQVVNRVDVLPILIFGRLVHLGLSTTPIPLREPLGARLASSASKSETTTPN